MERFSAVSEASDAARSVRNCLTEDRRTYLARLSGVGNGDELETACEEVLAGEVVAQVESAERLQSRLGLLDGDEREAVLHAQLGEEGGDAGRFFDGECAEELGMMAGAQTDGEVRGAVEESESEGGDGLLEELDEVREAPGGEAFPSTRLLRDHETVEVALGEAPQLLQLRLAVGLLPQKEVGEAGLQSQQRGEREVGVLLRERRTMAPPPSACARSRRRRRRWRRGCADPTRPRCAIAALRSSSLRSTVPHSPADVHGGVHMAETDERVRETRQLEVVGEHLDHRLDQVALGDGVVTAHDLVHQGGKDALGLRHSRIATVL